MTDTIVTGSSGFIGSHLMKRLPDAKKLKHEDIVYGHSYNAQKLFFLSTYGNMAWHTDERMMLKANVEDLMTLLTHFTGWFCYMSSSSVNLLIQTTYSRTKKVGEGIVQSLQQLTPCIVRPYSVTGVNEQEKHLIPTLIRSCMEGEPMTFDPEPVHDFVDVEDVVDGLINLSELQATGIHEFGRGIPWTNQDVRVLVEHATGKKANIKGRTYREYDSGDWYCRTPSPAFTPRKYLRDSIQEMVEDYKRTH